MISVTTPQILEYCDHIIPNLSLKESQKLSVDNYYCIIAKKTVWFCPCGSVHAPLSLKDLILPELPYTSCQLVYWTKIRPEKQVVACIWCVPSTLPSFF